MNKKKINIAKKVIVPLCKDMKRNFKKPILLIIMGVVGAGKSTIAKKIAKEYPFYYAAADNVRVALCKNPTHGSVETSETYSIMYAVVEELLQQGKSVIIDATLPKKKYRDELQDRFGKMAHTILLFIDRSPDEIRKRVSLRKENLQNPLGITFALNEKLLERFLQELEIPDETEADNVFTIFNNDFEKVDNELMPLRKRLDTFITKTS